MDLMPQSQTVQSLHRGLDLLECVASAPDGLTGKELSDRTRLKNTTLFNLARTLVERGYLQKSRTRPVVYTMGVALEDLCSGNVSTSREAMDNTLLRLAKEHPKWRFITAEAHGVEVKIGHVIEPTRPETILHDTRKWMPPYTSASSLCHIAFWPQERVRSLRQSYPFAMYGVGLWGSEEKLEAAIAGFRQAGAVDIHNLSPVRLAAPLFNRSNQLVATIGASYLTDAFPATDERLKVVDELKKAAEELRPYLGTAPAGV